MGIDTPFSLLCLTPGLASALAGPWVGVIRFAITPLVRWVQAAEPEGQEAASSPQSLRARGSPHLVQGWPSGPRTSLKTREPSPEARLSVGGAKSVCPRRIWGEASGRHRDTCPNSPGTFAGMGPGGGQQEALTPQEEKHSVRQC